jgi:hypothetical protein
MPHYVQSDAMEELQKIFYDQYMATSSHPFRQGDDIQMMFAYIYFLRHHWEEFNLYRSLQIFSLMKLHIDRILQIVLSRDVDSDEDGFLNANEMWTLAAILNGTVTFETYSPLLRCIAEAKVSLWGTLRDDEINEF